MRAVFCCFGVMCVFSHYVVACMYIWLSFLWVCSDVCAVVMCVCFCLCVCLPVCMPYIFIVRSFASMYDWMSLIECVFVCLYVSVC